MNEQLPLYRHRRHQRLHDRIVSRLLWMANTRPPVLRRREFYELKQRLCERYGVLLGHDWQHIRKVCWTCDGTGTYMAAEMCRRCDGTGIFDEYHVKLERWQFGRYIFHRPLGRYRKPDDAPANIEGRIQHDDIGRAANEAALWLALIYDRRLFWALMRGSCCHGRYCYPLLIVQRVVWTARAPWRWWWRAKRKLREWRWRRAQPVMDDEDIPF